MLFNSNAFLLFMAAFCLPYFLLSRTNQIRWIFVCSLVFYGWWDWRFVPLLLWCILFTHACVRRLEAARPERRKFWLTLTIIVNLAPLLYFKYTSFLASNVSAFIRLFDSHYDGFDVHVLLPIGVSFFTFHALSYASDVYRRKTRAAPTIPEFGAYLAFFPHLVAGPIVRAARILPQMATAKRPRWPRFFLGAEKIVYGFLLKVALADNLAPIVDRVFHQPGAFSGLNVLVACFFFSFQIYGDFAGYSLIAIGIAQVLGYDFGRNFRRPYLATSFSDFWQRWHISLSSWLRDYVYIPLGGNRYGSFKTYRNLFATMLLGGLWHGANWTFIVWGGMHGLLLVMQRLLGGFLPQPAAHLPAARFAYRLAATLLVFLCVQVTWVFFRAPDFATAAEVLTRIVLPNAVGYTDLENKFEVAKGLLLIAILVAAEVTVEYRLLALLGPHGRLARVSAAFGSILVLSLLGNFSGESFIYFKF